ncbi:MAG: hypothetical protein Q7K11_00300 [Candidatus Berkelbacteria bacterium]|nr:hypothetical protein [Candidatus Berkelbacteria bacterium]
MVITNLNTWIYFGLIQIILILGLFWSIKGNLSKYSRYVFGLVLGLFLVHVGASILLLYLAVKKSPLSTYLLSGKDSFFVGRLENIGVSVGSVLLLAVVLYLLSRILIKRQKRQFLEEEFPLIVAVIVIIAGLSNIIPVIFLALVSGIFYQVLTKNRNSISLIPFLLTSMIIINTLNIFPFYREILSRLHLL